MNNAPHILHCPNCKERKDYVNMGSITTEGYVILKRPYANRFTMIMSTDYSIVCDCGYFIRIENGKVAASAPTANMISG